MRWGNKPVYICCGGTDLRSSINGLVALVQGSFELNPFSNALFAFCNKRRDMIKILEWDGDGFWLYMKRLERGRFPWPKESEDEMMGLESAELSCLIEGTKLEKKLKREEIFQ